MRAGSRHCRPCRPSVHQARRPDPRHRLRRWRPARYLATRFGCNVRGIDLTPAFVEAANRLTALLGLERQVTIEQGDAMHLPYPDGAFDGACARHVTMNIPDRSRFLRRGLAGDEDGAFLALTEHGLGPVGQPPAGSASVMACPTTGVIPRRPANSGVSLRVWPAKR
jgi:hypothetical protein